MKAVFLFCLCIPILSWSQSSPVITAIQIEGAKKTQYNFIQRYLQLETGQDFDSEKLAEDLQAIKNLDAISDAFYTLDTTDVGIRIRYHLKENQTWEPIIGFGGIKNNFWYQFGYKDFNWQGNGQQIQFYYRNNDRRHNFSFYHKIPHIGPKNWGLSYSIDRWASIEPLFFSQGTVRYFFNYFSIASDAIYHFDNRHHLSVGANFFTENYEKTPDQPLENPPGPDQLKQPKSLLKLVYQYNRINHQNFYRNGWANQLILQSVYTYADQSFFHIAYNDTHYLRRIGRLGNLAARLRLGISTNNNSPFAPFVLDSQLNIRGSGNRIDRGTATIILNLEYRQTVLHINSFAVQLVAFSDRGTWRSPGGNLEEVFRDDFLRHFVGGGIRLIYEKSLGGIIRLDYGIDLEDGTQRGFVFGAGQYF